MAAGLGFKTFTTGEVLTAADTNGYLMQGVLVFASAAARDAAITSPQEGQFAYLKDTNVTTYYTGSAWANLDTTGMTNPMTTTGDTIYSSSGSTPARLGIGSTGQVLTVAGGIPSWATPAGGGGTEYAAGKNGQLNSAMNVWQRGTSVSVASSTNTTYTADRYIYNVGANQASTVSRQATGDTTNLPFIQYCARVQRNASQTGTGTTYFISNWETINSIPLAGKTVTFSFYARAGANYSATSSTMTYKLVSGTGTDQNESTSGFTGATNVVSQSAVLTTTWQRFSYSGTVSATATQLATEFLSNWSGTAGANDYYEVTGVQIEIAASATAFSPNCPTYATELAACQRYYWQTDWTTLGQNAGYGWAEDTTYAGINLYNPVPMRVKASSFIYSNVEISDFVNTPTTISSGASLRNARSIYITSILVSASGSPLTQFRSYALRGNGSTGYIGVSAEL